MIRCTIWITCTHQGPLLPNLDLRTKSQPKVWIPGASFGNFGLSHLDHMVSWHRWGGMVSYFRTCTGWRRSLTPGKGGWWVGVGRGGMLPFPGTCKSNKGWCRVGCCPSLAIRNPAEIKKSEKQQILAKPYKTVQTHSRRNVDQTFLVT